MVDDLRMSASVAGHHAYNPSRGCVILLQQTPRKAYSSTQITLSKMFSYFNFLLSGSYKAARRHPFYRSCQVSNIAIKHRHFPDFRNFAFTIVLNISCFLHLALLSLSAFSRQCVINAVKVAIWRRFTFMWFF